MFTLLLAGFPSRLLAPPLVERVSCPALVDVIAYQWGITYHVIVYHKLSHSVIVYHMAVSLV